LKNISDYIDHTSLRPDDDKRKIEQLCQEAITHQFKAVCVAPYYVSLAHRMLENKGVKVATVIGFPLGYTPTVAKVEVIKRAIDEGADELDVVINLAAVKSEDWTTVTSDIDSCTRATHLKGKIIKVIIETSILSETEIDRICTICTKIGVDYIKTSTGFNGSGATLEVVRYLRDKLPSDIKIKASGGIRTFAQAKALIEAGADRLGSSSGVSLLNNEDQ